MTDETTTETTNATDDETSNALDSSTEVESSEGQADEDETVHDGEQSSDDAEMFDRAYVDGLRDEAAKHRIRAKDRDQLAQRLHTELVRATGRLADPTDLPFDEDHLDDPERLSAAVDDLLTRKPHLAARRPIGEIGQGATTSAGTVDLAAILRGKAG